MHCPTCHCKEDIDIGAKDASVETKDENTREITIKLKPCGYPSAKGANKFVKDYKCHFCVFLVLFIKF